MEKINVAFKGGELDGQSLELQNATVQNGVYTHSIHDAVEVYEICLDKNQAIAVYMRSTITSLAPRVDLGMQVISGQLLDCTTCNVKTMHHEKSKYEDELNFTPMRCEAVKFTIYECSKCNDEAEVASLDCKHCHGVHEHILMERYRTGSPGTYIKDFKCLNCGREQQILH